MFISFPLSMESPESKQFESIEIHLGNISMNSDNNNSPPVHGVDTQSQKDPSWFEGSVGQQFLPAKASIAREWINRRKEGLKPWREFFSSDKFRAPGGIAVAGQRLARNIENFQSNYLCVFLILVVYCILTSPMLLFALVALFGMLYVIKIRNYQKKLSIGGKELTPAFQYGVIAIISFPLFYVAGAGSAIFWVIGASMVFIVGHAVLYGSERANTAFIEEDV